MDNAPNVPNIALWMKTTMLCCKTLDNRSEVIKLDMTPIIAANSIKNIGPNTKIFKRRDEIHIISEILFFQLKLGSKIHAIRKKLIESRSRGDLILFMIWCICIILKWKVR